MAGKVEPTAFDRHTLIPHDYAHEAGDVSPPLQWSGVPDGTAELALLCEDPDAPTGTFIHWLVAGIPPETAQLDTGAELKAYAVGRNDYGRQGYGGAAPAARRRPPPVLPPHLRSGGSIQPE